MLGILPLFRVLQIEMQASKALGIRDINLAYPEKIRASILEIQNANILPNRVNIHIHDPNNVTLRLVIFKFIR